MPPEPSSLLGRELYELMKAPAGTTVAAIRQKPGLMSLSYIRAQVPSRHDKNAYEQALAMAVREHLEAESYALGQLKSQRPKVGADNGAAVRCLLAIEHRTETLPLHKRRKRAAKEACLEVGSMRKRQETQGVQYTDETKLMDALAEKLEALEKAETDKEPRSLFDRSVANRLLPNWAPPPLADYYRAWSIANRFEGELKGAVGCVKRKSELHHQETLRCANCFPPLMSHARLIAATTIIGDPDTPWRNWGPFPARDALRRIQVALPFDDKARTRLEQGISTEIGLSQLARAFGPDVASQWDTWLRTCDCAARPKPACRVHQAIAAIVNYIDCVEAEWRRLQDGLRALTPSEFVTDSERVVYGRIGLRLPASS